MIRQYYGLNLCAMVSGLSTGCSQLMRVLFRSEEPWDNALCACGLWWWVWDCVSLNQESLFGELVFLSARPLFVFVCCDIIVLCETLMILLGG